MNDVSNNDTLVGEPMIRQRLSELLGKDVAGTIIEGVSVLERLMQRIIAGQLILTPEDKLTVPEFEGEVRSPWLYFNPKGDSRRGHYPSCQFLTDILYKHVYGKSQAPLGCRTCYKVKVDINSVAELVAVRDISHLIPCDSKCGTEVGRRYTQSRYAAFFYVDGLEHAGEVYTDLDERINANKKIAETVKISIKRGCTPYEMQLGPSDEWQFDESMQAVEDILYGLFKPASKGEPNKLATWADWIETAYKIGDDSYLELTHGKRLFPATVDYSIKNKK